MMENVVEKDDVSKGKEPATLELNKDQQDLIAKIKREAIMKALPKSALESVKKMCRSSMPLRLLIFILPFFFIGNEDEDEHQRNAKTKDVEVGSSSYKMLWGIMSVMFLSLCLNLLVEFKERIDCSHLENEDIDRRMVPDVRETIWRWLAIETDVGMIIAIILGGVYGSINGAWGETTLVLLTIVFSLQAAMTMLESVPLMFLTVLKCFPNIYAAIVSASGRFLGISIIGFCFVVATSTVASISTIFPILAIALIILWCLIMTIVCIIIFRRTPLQKPSENVIKDMISEIIDNKLEDYYFKISSHLHDGYSDEFKEILTKSREV